MYFVRIGKHGIVIKIPMKEFFFEALNFFLPENYFLCQIFFPPYVNNFSVPYTKHKFDASETFKAELVCILEQSLIKQSRITTERNIIKR